MRSKPENNRRKMTVLGSTLGALAISLTLTGAASTEQTGTETGAAPETTLVTASPARPMPWDVPAHPVDPPPIP